MSKMVPQSPQRSVIVGTRLIPDHGHLMHLFLIRSPKADCFYHLHPEMSDQNDPPAFTQTLPSLPAGHYQIFADIVRASGFPDTMTAEIDLPETTGAPLTGDDSEIVTAAITPSVTSGNTAELSDGSHMIWAHDATPLRAGKAILFRFRVDDKNGKPATDLEQGGIGACGEPRIAVRRTDLVLQPLVPPDVEVGQEVRQPRGG